MQISKSAIFKEMLASQKRRDDLMKWKLIVISALGAAGLGLVENKCFDNLQLILTVIPVACVYIDMLCRYLSLRTKRINSFISTLDEPNDIDVKYAKFYLNLRPKAGGTLESYALFLSTIFYIPGDMQVGVFDKRESFGSLFIHHYGTNVH